MAGTVKKGCQQERVNEKYFAQRITTKESRGILKLVKDNDTKKAIRWAWEKTQLAHPKHDRVVTAWLLVADLVMKMEDTVEKDLLKCAIVFTTGMNNSRTFNKFHLVALALACPVRIWNILTTEMK